MKVGFIVTDVRALLRYLLITGLLMLLAFGLFAVPFRGRTLFGHLRATSGEDVQQILAEMRDELDARKKADQAEPTKTSEARVADLRSKSAKVSFHGKSAQSSEKKTKIDENVSGREKRALDQLLTSRLNDKR